MQIGAGKRPAERRRGRLIPVLKGHQIVFQGGQRREVIRGEDLALHDREVDFDLVQPAGMKMFGTIALCSNGKVFMFPWKSRLVFTIPEDRADEIITGEYFDPGHGRTSKTWVVMSPNSKSEWSRLVRVAREFAMSK